MLNSYRDGQPIAVAMFEKAIKDDKLSHAYLIDTNNYTDAFGLVLAFVKAIVCPNNCLDNNNCQECSICKRIDTGNYLELKVIEPDGTWIKKEQLLDLQEAFSMKGIEGSKRIYIIKECDKMNVQTANSILKFLEEPCDNIIAILMTNNISKLLDTIVSRCQLVRLFADKKEKASTLEQLKALIINNTTNKDNYIDDAKNVELLDNLINFVKEYEHKKLATIVNIKKVWHNNFNNKDLVELAMSLLINFYYDVLLVLCDKDIVFFTDYREVVEEVSSFNDVDSILHKLDVLIDAKSVLKFNLNLNLFIDKLIIDMEVR